MICKTRVTACTLKSSFHECSSDSGGSGSSLSAELSPLQLGYWKTQSIGSCIKRKGSLWQRVQSEGLPKFQTLWQPMKTQLTHLFCKNDLSYFISELIPREADNWGVYSIAHERFIIHQLIRRKRAHGIQKQIRGSFKITDRHAISTLIDLQPVSPVPIATFLDQTATILLITVQTRHWRTFSPFLCF